MRIPRIFHFQPLAEVTTCQLSDNAFNHVVRVLRLTAGDEICLFDGSNWIFYARLTEVNKKTAMAEIFARELESKESPLHLHLGQVISRGERMEFTVQKAVELGVSVITPLLSERCGVRMDEQRMAKKIYQWQQIAISACEQCGRNQVPEIRPLMTLGNWCVEEPEAVKLNLHPRAENSMDSLPDIRHRHVRLLIGSEGGLSDAEINQTVKAGFLEIKLGRRILRTETASITAITALQLYFGDLNS